jgi:folate-binding protein YgfZ
VTGADAVAWLHDLVTADVAGLSDGRSLRSLLLTPTGRIRADFHVAEVDGSYLLLQSPSQPEPIDSILAPYVLSSDVSMDDRTDRSAVVAVLDGGAAENGHGALVLSPSVLGQGRDLVVPPGEAATRLREHLRAAGLVEAAAEDVEAWRILRGIARMGVDFEVGALPAEAGLEDAIDFTKGCFLGQESVAKVRNLGHAPRVLLHVRSRSSISSGTPVLSGAVVVGEVTSAAETSQGTDAIVRVRWKAASQPLSTKAGPLALQHQQ